MTNEPSPRPWRAEPSGRVGTDCLFDANGTYIGTVPKIDSALIVDAVNERVKLLNVLSEEQEHGYLMEEERDRLRDIVRRLANMAETTIPDAMENWGGFTSGRVEFEREAYALIREARAAIGEGGAAPHA